jgi:hypothetical protein
MIRIEPILEVRNEFIAFIIPLRTRGKIFDWVISRQEKRKE